MNRFSLLIKKLDNLYIFNEKVDFYMCIESFHRSEELRPEAKNFKTFFVHTVNIFN